MAEYGLQISKNGRWFASPKYTPYNLVQVTDVELTNGMSSTVTVDTNIPNDITPMIFGQSSNAAATILHRTDNGANGTKKIVIYLAKAGNGIQKFKVRFYCFANFVAWAPRFGLFTYNPAGRMTWCGNCLPLEVKYKTWNEAAPTVPCASTYSYAEAISNGQPGLPGSLLLLLNWVGSPTGVARSVYQNVSSSAGGTVPASSAGYLYIETGIYDQYYRASLGY